jgi:signal transduction histidine kinase
MILTDYERLPNPRLLFMGMLRAIAASIAVDTSLLALFVAAGVAARWLPIAYALVGFGICAAFYALIASGWSARFRDSSLAIYQLATMALMQLVFMVLAPTVALYFVAVLFVAFGFGSLRLRFIEAAIACTLVSVALGIVTALIPLTLEVPHATLLQRVLVGLSIALTLARCTMLGLYGSHRRVLLSRRHAAVKASLQSSESHQASVAEALHDDLGQELAGMSLLLSACATRLRREQRSGAEIDDIAAQLRAAVEKTRVLAVRAHPRWRTQQHRKLG